MRKKDVSGISLRLDGYDDIFSDFDPRTYGERALSHDFLMEAKRASVDKIYDGIELALLVPGKQRNAGYEIIIKKRLRKHFRKHARQLRREKGKIIRMGLGFTGVGLILMAVGAYVLSAGMPLTLYRSFLIILLEPAAWFFFWEGLSQMIFESKKLREDAEFYSKMERSIIRFGAHGR